MLEHGQMTVQAGLSKGASCITWTLNGIDHLRNLVRVTKMNFQPHVSRWSLNSKAAATPRVTIHGLHFDIPLASYEQSASLQKTGHGLADLMATQACFVSSLTPSYLRLLESAFPYLCNLD